MSSKRIMPGYRLFKDNNLSYQNYRFFMVIGYSSIIGVIVSSFLVLLYIFLKIYLLTASSVISTIVYITSFTINRRGHHKFSFFLIYCTVISHAILTTVMLGWDSGFHYHIICLVPIVFFSPGMGSFKKLSLTAFCNAVYISLSYYLSKRSPVYSISQVYIGGTYYLNIIVTFCILAYLVYFYDIGAARAEHSLRKANRRLQLLAGTDPLTGLLNRRSILDKLECLSAQYRMNNKPFTIVVADVDRYKSLNDEYGHECGDTMLISVSGIIKKMLRKNDFIARWGGDEFLIILPETDLDESRVVVEKLRNALNESKFTYENSEINVTMTFGVCMCSSNTDTHELINNADQALYEGKRNGRNCAVFHDASIIAKK